MKGRRTSSARGQLNKPQVSQKPSNISGFSKNAGGNKMMPPKHPRSNMFVAQASMDLENPNPFVVMNDVPIGALGRQRS